MHACQELGNALHVDLHFGEEESVEGGVHRSQRVADDHRRTRQKDGHNAR